MKILHFGSQYFFLGKHHFQWQVVASQSPFPCSTFCRFVKANYGQNWLLRQYTNWPNPEDCSRISASYWEKSLGWNTPWWHDRHFDPQDFRKSKGRIPCMRVVSLWQIFQNEILAALEWHWMEGWRLGWILDNIISKLKHLFYVNLVSIVDRRIVRMSDFQVPCSSTTRYEILRKRMTCALF